jgi:hypothetical protein
MNNTFKPSGNIVRDPATGIFYSKNGVPPKGLKPIKRPVCLVFTIDENGKVKNGDEL